MKIRWPILAATVIATMANCVLLEGQSFGAQRDKILWSKKANFKANFNLTDRPSQKPRAPVLTRENHGFERALTPQPPKILATFELEEGAHPQEAPASVLASRPTPTRCEWAKSIVAGFAFENVKATACDRSVLAFEATRDGRKYAIEVSAINGDLIKVERIGGANSPRGLSYTIGPD